VCSCGLRDNACTCVCVCVCVCVCSLLGHAHGQPAQRLRTELHRRAPAPAELYPRRRCRGTFAEQGRVRGEGGSRLPAVNVSSGGGGWSRSQHAALGFSAASSPPGLEGQERGKRKRTKHVSGQVGATLTRHPPLLVLRRLRLSGSAQRRPPTTTRTCATLT
jgi:hypothetical protein